MKIIGITGGVGAGKTEVLEYLNNRYGATVCQTDQIAKKLQKKGGVCYDAIVQHFGRDVLDGKEELEREKLGGIVFADPVQRDILNRIVHPAVKEEVDRLIAQEKRKNTNLFLIESAILIEAQYGDICDEVWYIYVEDSARRNRLFYARGYDSKKIEEIIAAQLPKEQFLKNCDRVIDNNGVFAETMAQLDKIVKDL